MSERSENLRRILSEIGDKFEELFHELKKDASHEEGEINKVYQTLRNRMKEAEDDVKEFVGDNKETIDRFKGKFEEITHDLSNAFDKAFNNK